MFKGTVFPTFYSVEEAGGGGGGGGIIPCNVLTVQLYFEFEK